MSDIPRALLLIGSPKPAGKSTSESLGTYLIDQLTEKGWHTDIFNAVPALHSDETISDLFSFIDKADLIIFSSPLYVDSIPASVMRIMELFADHRASNPPEKPQRFMAISNSGFPETSHNDTAISIYRQFAIVTGFDWTGGLPLGMGGAIVGRPLNTVGGMVKNVMKALDLTAESLNHGNSVPDEAVKLFHKPMMPHRLYVWGGEYGWKKGAKKFGAHKRLDDRPYQDG